MSKHKHNNLDLTQILVSACDAEQIQYLKLSIDNGTELLASWDFVFRYSRNWKTLLESEGSDDGVQQSESLDLQT
jgi:hypothetical protein